MGTVILTHGDGDGMCAGAIALSRFPDARVFFTKPVSLLKDLQNEAGEDTVIICDIALTRRDAGEILKLLREKRKVLYFDHHPVPDIAREADVRDAVKLYVHDLNASASELIYRHYQRDLPKERVWPALYGAIADYSEDTDFVKERMRNWDHRALYFEVSALVLGIKADRFSGYDGKRRILKTMASGGNPSDVRGLVDSARLAVRKEFQIYGLVKSNAKRLGSIGYVKDLRLFGFRGPSALFAATVTDSPVGLSIYTRRKYLDITMRKRRGDSPLNLLAEKAAEEVGGSGGGHKEAAGARIPLGSLERFLKTVNKEIK
jgi:single-stranded-DNA-specific exonuclease